MISIDASEKVASYDLSYTAIRYKFLHTFHNLDLLKRIQQINEKYALWSIYISS